MKGARGGHVRWLEGGWGTGFWIERILSRGRAARGRYCGGEVGGQ